MAVNHTVVISLFVEHLFCYKLVVKAKWWAERSTHYRHFHFAPQNEINDCQHISTIRGLALWVETWKHTYCISIKWQKKKKKK